MEQHASNTAPSMLSDADLALLDRYWRAANYLSGGQIYLLDNPLLREPLKPEHIKPRLLGHWGTTPGLNFIYVHLNRMIRARDLDIIYMCGPGHGGPGMVANTYLEGTYSEIYPDISEDADGMRKLFRQFSFPGGIPSHAAPETPGSIHEGGWTGPKEVDGKKVEGFAHQVPVSNCRGDDGHRKILEGWMRSYEPENLFDADGGLKDDLQALAPEGNRWMGANPHANGGLLRMELSVPDIRDYEIKIGDRGSQAVQSTEIFVSTCAMC
jgi:phosphoketolase